MIELLFILIIILILLSISPFNINYVSNQNGELSTVGIWTPNGHPGLTDEIQIGHKITITDTVEYIRRFIVNTNGEMEINAVTQDAGLIIQNATFMRMFIQPNAVGTAGILDMNGTEDYTAYIRPNEPVDKSMPTVFGNLQMNYAEISGFYHENVFATNLLNAIEVRNAQIAMVNSYIESAAPYPFYFWGDPTTTSMSHSYFKNIWPSLYRDTTHYFAFNEFLNDIHEVKDVIGVRHGVTGRNKSRNHRSGMMGREFELSGSFQEPENRWKIEDLQALIDDVDKYWVFLDEKIIPAAWLGPLEVDRPAGSITTRDFTMSIEEADED